MAQRPDDAREEGVQLLGELATPTSCLQPGSTVEVLIRYQARLPVVPPLMGHNPASIAVSARHVEPYGSYCEAAP